ncbi:unnamed protein product, partial [Prorocentrum cordatum]
PLQRTQLCARFVHRATVSAAPDPSQRTQLPPRAHRTVRMAGGVRSPLHTRSSSSPRGGVNAAPAAEDAGAARGKTRKTGCARVPGVAQGGGGERRGYAAAAGGAGGSRRRRPARPSPPLGGRRSEDDVVVLLRAVQRAGHIEGRHGRWHRQALGL